MTNLTVQAKSIMQAMTNIMSHTLNGSPRLLYCTENCLDSATNHTLTAQH